jgi:hypothetical protein
MEKQWRTLALYLIFSESFEFFQPAGNLSLTDADQVFPCSAIDVSRAETLIPRGGLS